MFMEISRSKLVTGTVLIIHLWVIYLGVIE